MTWLGRRCIIAYYTMNALHGIAIGATLPVWQMFLVQRNISVLQLGLLGALFEGTMLVFEIPSGGWADTWGRLALVVAGSFIAGLSRIAFGLSTFFLAFALAEVLFGFAESCTHGAVEAWVADGTADDRDRMPIKRVLSTGRTFMLLSLMMMSMVSGYVFRAFPSAVFFISGLSYILAGCSVLLIGRERAFTRPVQKQGFLKTFVSLSGTCRNGLRFVRAESILLVALCATAVVGFAGDAVDRYWQLVLSSAGSSPELLGQVIAVSTLVGAAFIQVMVRCPLPPLTSLLIVEVVCAGALLAVVLYNPALMFAGILLYMIVKKARYPLFMDFLSNNVPSEVHATVFSVNSVMNSLGEILAGVVLGAIAQALGLRLTFVVAGVLSASACSLYLWLVIKRTSAPDRNAAIS